MGQKQSQPRIFLPNSTEQRKSSVLIPTFYSNSSHDTNYHHLDVEKIFTGSDHSGHLMTYVIAPWDRQLCPKLSNLKATDDFKPYIYNNREKILSVMENTGWAEPFILNDVPIVTKYTTDFTLGLGIGQEEKNKVATQLTNNFFQQPSTNPHLTPQTIYDFITLLAVRGPSHFIQVDLKKVYTPQGYHKYTQTNLRTALDANDLPPRNQLITPIDTRYSPQRKNAHIFEISTVGQNRFLSSFKQHYDHIYSDSCRNSIFQNIPFSFLLLDLTNGLTTNDLTTIPPSFRSMTPNEIIEAATPGSIYGDLRPIVTFCNYVTQLINMGSIYPIHLRPIHIVRIGREHLDRHEYHDGIIIEIFESFGLDMNLVKFHDLNSTTTYIELSQLFHTILNEEFATMLHTHSLSSLLPITHHTPPQPQLVLSNRIHNDQPPLSNDFSSNDNDNNEENISPQLPQPQPHDEEKPSDSTQQYVVQPMSTFMQITDFVVNTPSLFLPEEFKFVPRHDVSNALLYTSHHEEQDNFEAFIKSRAYRLYQMKSIIDGKPIKYKNPQLIIQPSYRPRFYAPYQFIPEIMNPQSNVSEFYYKPAQLLFKANHLLVSTINNNTNNNNDHIINQTHIRCINGQKYQLPFPSIINLPTTLHFSSLFIEMNCHSEKLSSEMEQFMKSLCQHDENGSTIEPYVIPTTETFYYSHKAKFSKYILEPYEIPLTQLFTPQCIIQRIYPQYYTQNHNNNYTYHNNNNHNEHNNNNNHNDNNHSNINNNTDNIVSNNTNNTIESQPTTLPKPDDISISISVVASTIPHGYRLVDSQFLSLPLQHLFIGYVIPANLQSWNWSEFYSWERIEYNTQRQCLFHPQYVPSKSNIEPNTTYTPIIKGISSNDSIFNKQFDDIASCWYSAKIAKRIAPYTSYTSIPIHFFIVLPDDWDVNCNELNSYISDDNTIRDIVTQKYDNVGKDEVNKMNLCARFRSYILKQLLLLHTTAFGPYQNQFCNGIIQGGAMGLCNVVTHPHLYYRVNFLQLQQKEYCTKLMKEIQQNAITQRMKLIEESWGM